ncbi:hypothetical protein DET57_1531 [Klebsiella oxytoca]|uniref:Uncharacterized protein n=2 Tax=Klebsiella oxytoca TaxID=571 RepID=A0A318F005_KLEOX|nr:hypothetical protein DET57_1531 [Klebsiella oxytoca]
MMSLWDALRMNMMISYQELVRTFPRCGREMTMNRLIEENGENIHSHVNEIQKDLEKKLIKDLSDKLKKTFKGNKNIRIK